MKENLRVFKQTRFDQERFENAVENVRSAKKAVAISKARAGISEKIKLAVKKGLKLFSFFLFLSFVYYGIIGDVPTQIKLLEKAGDYSFDLSDEHKVS